jgi:hypothetical protein
MFNGHLEYFKAIWYTLWPFGIHNMWSLGLFFPLWYVWTEKIWQPWCQPWIFQPLQSKIEGTLQRLPSFCKLKSYQWMMHFPKWSFVKFSFFQLERSHFMKSLYFVQKFHRQTPPVLIVHVACSINIRSILLNAFLRHSETFSTTKKLIFQLVEMQQNRTQVWHVGK